MIARACPLGKTASKTVFGGGFFHILVLSLAIKLGKQLA
jgi:hypothetical protein